MSSDHANHEAPQPPADVFWQAARYVWGELTPDEAAAFEERLAVDELACAAVAEAVTLSAGLKTTVRPAAVAGRAPIPARPASRWRLLTGWIAAAAIVLGFVVLSPWKPTRPSTVDLAAAELVGRWTSDGHLGLHGETEFRDDLDHEADVLDESLAAPHWLLNAVELTAKGSSSSP
jgi:hypothetical protein